MSTLQSLLILTGLLAWTWAAGMTIIYVFMFLFNKSVRIYDDWQTGKRQRNRESWLTWRDNLAAGSTIPSHTWHKPTPPATTADIPGRPADSDASPWDGGRLIYPDGRVVEREKSPPTPWPRPNPLPLKDVREGAIPKMPPNIEMRTGVKATSDDLNKIMNNANIDNVLHGLEQAIRGEGSRLTDLTPEQCYEEPVLALGAAICDMASHMPPADTQPCHVCCEVAEGLLERLEDAGYFVGS